MFDHLKNIDPNVKRREIEDKIKEAYKRVNHHIVRKVEQKNILLIGRTRTGKSTIKKVLVDPTQVADEMRLAAQTRAATFESFIIDDDAMVLNIIDTPGLFERGASSMDLMDNKTILKTIEQCVAREITKFHLICFCASFEAGINDEDVKAIKLLTEFLGPEVSQSACLVITRCESKSEELRNSLRREIESDTLFQPLTGYFRRGIFFSGSLDRDSYNNATDNLYYQFETIVAYRDKLIDALKENVEPFAVRDSNITSYRRLVEEQDKSANTETTATKKKDGPCSLM